MGANADAGIHRQTAKQLQEVSQGRCPFRLGHANTVLWLRSVVSCGNKVSETNLSENKAVLIFYMF